MAHRFTVWAPYAARVDVIVGEKGWPMSPVVEAAPSGRGWWTVSVSEAGPGTDYLFAVDGGPGRPDPRSRWQPGGVDGPSRVLDHSAFRWTDDRWRGLHLPSAVLYELHVGTFTGPGTFDAAIDRLDHLVALGVDGIELMPVAEFSGDRGWGYDGVDLFAPHHGYGGPEGLKRLVDACHAQGLGVVMDVVYNHLGPSGNYLSEFGPYFTDKHSTNWGDAVNFDDADSDGVRAFVVDNALMWLRDYHCDGLRLDAIHAIEDHSAVPIVEELASAVRALAGHTRRPLFVVAESDVNDPRIVRPADAGGCGVDAVWADEFHHALHVVLSGEGDGYYADFGSLALLAKALRQAWVYTGDYSPYRRRVHGRPPLGVGGARFVVFLQNHDQVGNRAQGDRITHLPRLRGSPGRARVGAALTLLAPFVPLLFQGEEWAANSPFLYFTDHRDPGLGAAVSEGRRREFGSFGWAPSDVPDPQDPSTFARSKLDWEEVSEPAHASMLAWYRLLISLRRRWPELSDGRRDQVAVTYDEAQGWLVVTRGAVTVAANLGGDEVTLPVAVPVAVPVAGSGSVSVPVAVPGVGSGSGSGVGSGSGSSVGSGPPEVLAASDPGVVVAPGGVVLPPDSVVVLREGSGP